MFSLFVSRWFKNRIAQFEQSSASDLDELVGVWDVGTWGRHIKLGMTVEKVGDRYLCKHTFCGLPIAYAAFSVRESMVGDVDQVYYCSFRLKLMDILWCDEMRLRPDGWIEGRVVVLPGSLALPISYFTYVRRDTGGS